VPYTGPKLKNMYMIEDKFEKCSKKCPKKCRCSTRVSECPTWVWLHNRSTHAT